MLLSAIYNNIASLVYGDIVASPPPAHEVTMMQSLILAKHNECQISYNFWFQKVIDTFDVVTGTSDYNFPDDFKELISTTIPDYDLTSTGFRLTSVPTADATYDIVYWSCIETPAWLNTYEDAVTIYLAWYIIYSVVADMMLKRSEQSEASAYYQLAEKAKFKAEQNDYHLRQVANEVF